MSEGLCPDLPFIEARGYYRSRRGREATILVIHCTAGWGNEDGLGRFFQKPLRRDGSIRQTSAHLGIGRYGGAAMYVPANAGAWHAGGGVDWEGRGQINLRSFGIELCNRGWMRKKIADKRKYQKKAPAGFTVVKHPKSPRLRHWEQYPREQLAKLIDLLPWITAELPNLVHVTGHEDLVRRKVDPGPLFPWHLIPWEEHGLVRMEKDWETGQWYEHRGGRRRPYRGPVA